MGVSNYIRHLDQRERLRREVLWGDGERIRNDQVVCCRTSE